jgi:hypothetical protein
MTERLINSKCESKEAIKAEIAALPPEIKALVDEGKSLANGYPAVFVYIQSQQLQLYACIDAQLLVMSWDGSKDKLKAFIAAELVAHTEGFAMELVDRSHAPEMAHG